MTAALLLGALGGLGAFLVVRALTSRPSLEDRLADLGIAAPAAPGIAAPAARRRAPRDRRRRDLRVVGRTPERHGLERIAASLAGLGTPVVMAAVLAAGGQAVPYAAVVLAGLSFAVAGFLLPDLLLRQAAARRRSTFVHGLSAYLDLVTVLLAGSAGTETALTAAAEAGDGWVFEELRAALDEARLLRRSLWDALAQLGQELDVPALVELAASVRLAGTQGARVRATLTARAEALRVQRLAEAESAATVATEQMAVPNVALFAGFLVFVGYPAVASILAGS